MAGPMLKRSVAGLVICFLWLFVSVAGAQAYYEGAELGYIDNVTINGQAFENLGERQIVFYPEDLRNGAVVIRGLLENERKQVPVDQLQVQITMDGGETWLPAKGTGRWEFHFSPELERRYDFSIRVVQNLGAGQPEPLRQLQDQLWRLGEFELRTAVAARAGELSGQGSIALGWLGALLPARLLEPDTQALRVSFENLRTEAQRIVSGSIRVAVKTTITLPGAKLQLDSIEFSPAGATIKGGLSLDLAGGTLPDLPLDGIRLALDGLRGEFAVAGPGQPLNLVLFDGPYGVALAFDGLILQMDTRRQNPVAIKNLSGTLRFGPGFGNLQVPNLTLAADGAIHWGKNLAAGVADSGRRLVLPGGLFSLGELGGSLNLAEKSLSLSGTLILPPALGSATLSIPAERPLTLSAARGLSSDGPVTFNPENLPTIALENMDTRLSGLSIAIDNGEISGRLTGNLVFNQFGGLTVAVAAAMDKTGLKELAVDSGAMTRSFDLQGFATLALNQVNSGYKNGQFYIQIDGGITPRHELFADYRHEVELKGLRIFKSGIEFVRKMDGWKDLDGGTIAINAARLTLAQYGIGVEGGLLWFGLKGEAELAGNALSLTARIFQDGTSSISDFGFEGLTLTLGEFQLRTAARVAGGRISGEGFINAGFLTDFLPAKLRDPLTGELKVAFSNLAVDVAARKVTSGTVTVDFPGGLTVDLGAVKAELRSVSFGSSGASADGSIALGNLAGIDLPETLKELALDRIGVQPAGFRGTLSWQAATGRIGGGRALVLPVLTGEYGLALHLSRVELDVDTSRPSRLDVVRLTDLDGSIKLGPGYGMGGEVANLRLLAGGAITWGVTALADVQAGFQGKANEMAGGFSFTIPGTAFAVRNLSGNLSLAERRVDLWGRIVLPAELGGGSITLTQANGLQLTAAGLSTRGAVAIEPGAVGSLRLAGFEAKVSGLSLTISNNAVSGAVAADLCLNKFDNLPISVSAAIGNRGLTELVVAADRLQRNFTIGDFAAIRLDQVAGGYEGGNFFIALDGELTLNNSAIADLQRSFAFAGLRVYKDALRLANAATGMQDIPDAFITLNDSLRMSLNQYGVGVTADRFWIALAGGVAFGGQDLTATARLYHDGTFELGQLGGNLLIAIGDFTLRTAFNYAGGRITEAEGSLHLGAIMGAIPDGMKNPLGELPVTLRDLHIDLSDPTHPKLSSGTIAFNTPFRLVTDFFDAQIEGIEVGAVAGTPYGKLRGGSIAFHQVASLPALSGISLADVGLNGGGLRGTLTWSGSQRIPVFEHASYGIDAVLSRVGIIFDSSQSSLGEMVRLAGLEGSLAFGSGYAASVEPAIRLVDGAYGFVAGEAAAISLPGTSIKLQGFSGAFDFAAGSVTVGGRLVLPYETTQIAFAVDGLTFSAAGVSGSVALENPVAISLGGFQPLLTRAGLDFSGFALAGGSLDLDLTLEQFFNLQLSAALTVDRNGISDWSLGGATDAAFTADAGFAELTVSDLGAGYDSAAGLFFSMSTDITMKGGAVLARLPDDLSLSGLKVFADKIAVDAAQMASSFHGATASLGGLDLTLTRLGIGFDRKFYLLAAGNLHIANLCEAGAELKLYSDLSFDLNEIDIAFQNPALEFSGMLALYDKDPVYGTGFGAELDVLIAGTLPLAGALQVGSVAGDSGSFAYWRVAMRSGATIPLSPIPLNIYGIGGGIAYHMTVTADTGGVRFVPDENTAIALTALVDLGSQDNGYTYFGKFNLTMEPTRMRVVLGGDSWFMEGRGASGPPHLAALIELGSSPAMVHISARASMKKELSGMTMVGVNGEVDLLFAENDWHIYFGSATQRLQVTALEFLTGSGYVQLDSSGIAMGVRYDFDLEGSLWIFYGRLYGGAEIDLAAGIRPFYVDAQGKVWVGLEAGVKVAGSKYEIINAYAELGGRFKAPPVYIGLHGTLRYSFLGGWISGSWDMTFTMPENPPAGVADAGIEALPLVAYASPENAAQGVSRLGSITVRANLPIMEPFQYDDGSWYILCIKDPTRPNDVIDFSDVRAAMQKALVLRKDGEARELVGGRQGSMELNFTPFIELGAGQTYSYATTFELRRYQPDSGTIGPVVSTETVSNAFTTTSEEISFRERVYEVYPTRGTTPVYSATPIYLVTKAVFDGYAWNWQLQTERLTFEVLNAAGESIPGRIEGKMLLSDGEEGSRRYALNFIPERPLQPVRMVESSTGGKRAALLQADGSYLNPFTNRAADPASGTAGGQTATGTGGGRSGAQGARAGHGSVSARPEPTLAAGGGPALANNPLTAGTALGAGLAAYEAATADRYTWYWDGEYQIRIANAEGRMQFSSKFNLTLPAEGAAAPQYASSRAVIENGVTDPHFHVNFNVDQNAYRADVAEGQRTMVVPAIDALWPDFVRSVHGAAYPACRFRPPSAMDVFAGVMVPPSWDVVDDLPAEQRAYFRRAALEQCAPLAEQLEAIDQRFDQYKAEAFARNPSDDFRTLEFRFRTAAPINWNEVELAIDVAPVFSAEVAPLSCEQVMDQYVTRPLPSMLNGQPCGVRLTYFLTQYASAETKQLIGEKMHPLKVGPSMSHAFDRNEYIVRSQSGSLEHVLELRTAKEHFSGDDLLELIKFNRAADAAITLQQFGFARIYGRTLQAQDSAVDHLQGEFSLQRGDLLYQTGILDAVTPESLLGR